MDSLQCVGLSYPFPGLVYSSPLSFIFYIISLLSFTLLIGCNSLPCFIVEQPSGYNYGACLSLAMFFNHYIIVLSLNKNIPHHLHGLLINLIPTLLLIIFVLPYF